MAERNEQSEQWTPEFDEDGKRPDATTLGKIDNRGQASKLTREVHDLIVSNVAMGAPVEVAASVAGVSHVSFYNWINRGREVEGREAQALIDEQEVPSRSEHDDACVIFFKSVLKARAQWEALTLGKIQAAGDKSWQANAWLLERKYPERYGRKDRQSIELSGQGGGPIELAAVSPIGALQLALAETRERIEVDEEEIADAEIVDD